MWRRLVLKWFLQKASFTDMSCRNSCWYNLLSCHVVYCNEKIEKIKNEFNVLLAWQISEGIYWRVLISKMKLNQIWSCSSRHKVWVFFFYACLCFRESVYGEYMSSEMLFTLDFFCPLFSMDSIVLFGCCWLEETIFTKIHTFLTLVFIGIVCLNFVYDNDFHLYAC